MQWFLSLPMWQRLSIALSVVAFVFAASWYQARRRAANEPTWILPAAPVWAAPATVLGSFETLGEAMELWNRAVGCTVFVKHKAGDVRPDVTVQWKSVTPCGRALGDDGMDDNDLGGAYLCGDGTAEVHVADAHDLRLEYAIIAHELGHVLGMAHDPEPHSVMYPKGNIVAAQRAPIRPTDKDARALREHYCKSR